MHLLVDPSMKNLVKDLATLDFAGQKTGPHDNADSGQSHTGCWREVTPQSIEHLGPPLRSSPLKAKLDHC